LRKNKIRTVISGLGRIAWSYHLPALDNNPNFELVAAVDPLPERLNEAAEKWQIEHLYTSYDKMLDQVKPDLVVVASPTPFHTEQICKAFLHGANVFCEKPLTTSLQETDMIIAEMKRFKRKLMVYQPRRLDLDCQQAKAIIESNILGSVYMIKRSIQTYKRRNDWQALQRYGGGMLNNYGAHYIDQLLYITNQSISCEYCELKNLISQGDADDFVKLVLKTTDGILMDIEVNQVSAFEKNEWTICGINGTAIWDSNNRNWQIKYFNPDTLPSISLQTTLAALNRQYPNEKIPWQESDCTFNIPPQQDFYDNCYDYFALGQTPLVDLNETRQVMAIIDQAGNNNLSPAPALKMG
jgi:predicted dehydrogenase